MCVTEQAQTLQDHYAKTVCPVVGNKHACHILFIVKGFSSVVIIRHCPSRSTNNDAIAAGRDLVLGLLVVADVASAVRAVLIAASGAATVDLDTLALAGDSVALAGARAAVGAGGAVAGERGAGGGAVGAVREAGAVGGDGGGAEVGEDIVFEAGAAEAGSELLKILVIGLEDVLGGVRRHGLGGLDLGDGERSALGDVDGQGSTVARRLVLGRVSGRALAA